MEGLIKKRKRQALPQFPWVSYSHEKKINVFYIVLLDLLFLSCWMYCIFLYPLPPSNSIPLNILALFYLEDSVDIMLAPSFTYLAPTYWIEIYSGVQWNRRSWQESFRNLECNRWGELQKHDVLKTCPQNSLTLLPSRNGDLCHLPLDLDRHVTALTKRVQQKSCHMSTKTLS